MSPMRPVLASILQSALSATNAGQGWLLAVNDDRATVAAALGQPDPASLIGTQVTPSAAATLALQGGHAVAIQPDPTDAANSSAGGFGGTPSSILAVPCGDEAEVGLLEVVAKTGGDRFSFDDVELCSVLASIAGAALAEDSSAMRSAPSPAQLHSELQRLESVDASRYADVAQMIASLLGLS
jgi:hypothetical protein